MFDYLCATFNHCEPRCCVLPAHAVHQRQMSLVPQKQGPRGRVVHAVIRNQQEVTTQPLTPAPCQARGGIFLNPEPYPSTSTILENTRIITSHAY